MKKWSGKINIKGRNTEVHCNANSYFDAKRVFAQMYNVNENEVSFIKEVSNSNDNDPLFFFND